MINQIQRQPLLQFKSQIAAMGQSLPKEQLTQIITPQVIDRNIQLLFGDNSQASKAQIVNEPIIIISSDLRQKGSFQMRATGFEVNETLLKCVYHPNFEKTIKHLGLLVSRQLKGIKEAKLISLIPREKFRKCLNIANFFIFFTDENLIQTINLLSIRSDLEPKSFSLVQQYSKKNPELNQFIMDAYTKEELTQLTRMYRLSMNLMIELHLKLLTRSDFTLQIVDRLNQSVFVIYMKLLLQTQQKDITKREQSQNAKTLLKIGAYFLGLGLETSTASIYELAVMLLQSLTANHPEQLRDQRALPSHLFKSLPIISNNEMMQWIANNLLFSLRYVKKGQNFHTKLNINRIPSFKLLLRIFQHYQPQGNQITYLLEQVCLQTKTHQIQRVFVSQLAELYSKLQNATDIIKKYSQIGHVNYNVKGINKQVKIRPQEVRTELQSDEDSIRKEVVGLCAKYTIHMIFQKKQVYYQYSDKSLWNAILYQLEEEGSKELRQPEEFNKQAQEQLHQ